MVTGAEILAIAAREIGYQEGRNKHNKYGAWFGLDNEPWCMEFVQWVYDQAGLPLPLPTASCGGLLRWYERNQPECIVKEPIQGCIVIFDFSETAYETDHTGLFVKKDSKRITTIDGNTKNGNESNGGWVQQRTRNIKDLENIWYIKPRGLCVVDWDNAIKELTDEQAYKLYSKAVNHMVTMPLPTSWNAKEEWDEAIKMGITHGDAPMRPSSLLETAVMCKRVVKRK